MCLSYLPSLTHPLSATTFPFTPHIYICFSVSLYFISLHYFYSCSNSVYQPLSILAVFPFSPFLTSHHCVMNRKLDRQVRTWKSFYPFKYPQRSIPTFATFWQSLTIYFPCVHYTRTDTHIHTHTHILYISFSLTCLPSLYLYHSPPCSTYQII